MSLANAYAIDESLSYTIQQQKDKTVKGKVVDSNNEPVIGASVVIQGTNYGFITDLDGNFQFSYPHNAGNTLEVTYVGMEKVTLKIGDKTDFKIRMNDSQRY